MPRCTVHHLAKRFGSLAALRDAHFAMHSGEVLGLLGPNGAGKTTLLACMVGVLHPDAGSVRIDDRDATAAERRALFFYLADGIAPWSDQRVAWLLDFAIGIFGRGDYPPHDLLDTLRIAELRGHTLGTLSKGQRKRVLLAIALGTPHPVLLLDEPFDGLDLRLTRDVIALFRRVAASGRTLVLSIHNMGDAARVCDRLVLLDDGRTVAEGSLAELRARAGLPDAPLDDVFLALA